MVFVQAPELEDFRYLNNPKGVEVNWHPDSESSAAVIVKQTMPLGTPVIWAASEFSEMRRLRKLFQQDMKVAREQIYLSSYWKKGHSGEQHKAEKRVDQAQRLKSA